MTNDNKNIPTGFGYYLRRMSSTKDVQGTIKRVKDSKATWISLMVEAEDGYINSKSILKTYSDAFKSNGIKVWVWTFPGNKRAADVEESAAAAALAYETALFVNADGIMLDVEKAYKGKKKQLNQLVNETLDLRNGSSNNKPMGVGFVSYPIPTFHRDIDWTCATKCDFASPMIYDTSKTKQLVDRCYNEYTKYNPVWIPSMATYETESPDSEEKQLKGDFDRIFEGNGNRNIPAAIFWSESTTGDKERKLIADYSDLLFIK